jgi:hypothetical protein
MLCWLCRGTGLRRSESNKASQVQCIDIRLNGPNGIPEPIKVRFGALQNWSTRSLSSVSLEHWNTPYNLRLTTLNHGHLFAQEQEPCSGCAEAAHSRTATQHIRSADDSVEIRVARVLVFVLVREETSD